MYADYLNAILSHYQAMKRSGELPLRLLHPRPAKLRDECVTVYKERFEKRDLSMLKTFFDVQVDAGLVQAMSQIGVSKFKPLANFLKGETTTTDDKNLELLGWLVNYPHRPFKLGGQYEQVKERSEALTAEETSVTDDELISGNSQLPWEIASKERGDSVYIGEVLPAGKVGIGMSGKKWVAGLVLLLSIGIWLYFNSCNGNSKFRTPGQKDCMVWVEDHYESIACDSLPKRGLAQGLDSFALKNCRRITRPDTITEKDIGKIWYQKRRGTRSIDYYTGGGRDPIDPSRDLRRLSKYMFDKYLKKKIP